MHEEMSCNEFYDAYLPLILHCAKRYGLYEHEKEELIQSVLLDVFMKEMNYDPHKSKYSTFVAVIARNNAIDIKRKRKVREVSIEQQTDLAKTLDYDAFEKLWNAEWEGHILGRLLEELKAQMEPSTYKAFTMSVFHARTPAEIAAKLDISENAVYVYKKRAIAKLRNIYKELVHASHPYNKKAPFSRGGSIMATGENIVAQANGSNRRVLFSSLCLSQMLLQLYLR